MVDPRAAPPAGSERPDSTTRLSGTLHALEHATLWVERPVRRIAGSHRLNPLPHAGTIGVFLLGVVVLSGLYITLFFEFGHEASYASVQRMEEHVIQRVMRALHRYASAAMVLTTLVHAWRILVSRRFTPRLRRWRWASGVAALVLVWLAGVTGYWLIWDTRAQAISEATAQLLTISGAGTAFAIEHLVGAGDSSGSGLLLFVWFVHLGLTAAIGWFTWRHLRRSKLPWLPPGHWMALMGGALMIVSIGLPVGMLPPADPTQLVGDMPLDPFIMFLLPPLLSEARWAAVGAGAALLATIIGLPRLLQRRDHPPVVIAADRCTGCELCVVDCPYDALTMGTRSEGEPGLAILDPGRCVACGICLGSCAFDAIELPGIDGPAGRERPSAGQHIVIACERHVEHGGLTASPDHQIRSVRCAGMFTPGAVRILIEQGASDVQLVGCPPSDCRYGMGNQLAAERVKGDRSPHPARRHHGDIVDDWVSPLDLKPAVEDPGGHRSADPQRLPGGREVLVGAGLIVALSVVAVALGTRAPFRPGGDSHQVRVALDHTAGRQLIGFDGGAVGLIDGLEVLVDGDPLGRVAVRTSGDVSTALADWDMPPGQAEVEVLADVEGRRLTVFRDEVAGAAGRRVLVDLSDVPAPPGIEEGRRVFNSRSAGCQVCHSVEPGDDGVGPSLAGVATRAGGRVEGLTAELYLRQSILLPDQYIVEGWPAGQMLPIYLDRLSEEELTALLAYLMTLSEDSS